MLLSGLWAGGRLFRENVKTLGVICGLTVVLTCGCSIADKFGSRSVQVPAAPVWQGADRVDSLWNSSLPADTLFLSRDLSAMDGSLLAGSEPVRRGPASAEVLYPDSVWGWRVQLASSTDRMVLDALVARVEREFGTKVYLDCLGSASVLRIGAFNAMENAASERDRAISYGYTNAWIVQTKIPPHQFISEE
jgi:hypothetical protein